MSGFVLWTYERTQHILEVTALTHNIGIKVSEAMHCDCSRKHQEKSSPIAREILEEPGLDTMARSEVPHANNKLSEE